MTLVVDASIVVAALVDSGPAGLWAESLLRSEPLTAPHLMPAEVSNILRRAAIAGDITSDAAALAQNDLLALRVELFPFQPFASRVWALRANVTAYAAWYVALAEVLAAPLATLDAKLSRAAGPACAFVMPPEGSG
jgi:predicted nucleic acid-binding protein